MTQSLSPYSYNISANVDPTNAGVLLVHLSGAPAGNGGYRDAGFTKQLAQQRGDNDADVRICQSGSMHAARKEGQRPLC